MINIEIKDTIKFPDTIATQKHLSHIADRIIIPMIQEGIDKRTDVEGNTFPKLSPVTIAMKGNDRPLIETGRLRRSFYSKEQGKNAVIVTLTSDRKDIGKKLQIEGVDSRSGVKFFKFFGITDGMEQNAMDYMQSIVDGVVKKFNGK